MCMLLAVQAVMAQTCMSCLKRQKTKKKRFGPAEAAAQSHEQLGRPADKAYRGKAHPYTWSSKLNVRSRTVTVAVSPSR